MATTILCRLLSLTSSTSTTQPSCRELEPVLPCRRHPTNILKRTLEYRYFISAINRSSTSTSPLLLNPNSWHKRKSYTDSRPRTKHLKFSHVMEELLGDKKRLPTGSCGLSASWTLLRHAQLKRQAPQSPTAPKQLGLLRWPLQHPLSISSRL